MDTFDNTPDHLLKLTHKHEHPLDDIDSFINKVILGSQERHPWDDVWIRGETDDTTEKPSE
jgi:hypothetical protein